MASPQQLRWVLMWAAYWLMWASALTLPVSIWVGANWRVWVGAAVAFPLCYWLREASHDMWMDSKAPRIPSTFSTPQNDPDWE